MPLRLKSLDLQGYKTFASHSRFEFAGGITAIVGPNGSGKSNIADALRWVLGEQSYSLLRGKKTEDMIFAGSEHRPRAGMAQATITFDNTEQWLPVDFSEVALERRAYRDGRNDYLLNGQHVRLREINELLAQAGLSERTYTILGQGLVDASLALKAEDRRRLFEEAAGVGLYRARREEALKRLDNTARNLERVLDIMAELEPRLRSLERQARRAIEFSQAQAALKVTLREWYGYHWHRAQKDLADTRQATRRQELRVQEARALHERSQKEYLAFRERLSGLRARLNAWHRSSAELHSRWEGVSRELAVLEERRRAMNASLASLQSDRDRAADELALARELAAEAQKEADAARGGREEALGQLAGAGEMLQNRQAERVRLEEELSKVRSRIEALNLLRSENQARLDELSLRVGAWRERLAGLAADIRAAEGAVQGAAEKLQAARREREEAEGLLAQAEARLLEQREKAGRIEARRRAALEARAGQETRQSRLHAQREVLEQAEQSLAGFADGARFLLEAARDARLNGTRGALSASLDVPAELETAIAAALGESLDAVLLEDGDTEQALTLLESEEAGRAALLPVNPRTVNRRGSLPEDPECLGLAADLLRVPPELQAAVDVLLGQTWVVKDRGAARRWIGMLEAPGRIVTLRGEVFHADGRILAGRSGQSTTLGRARQKRELEAGLEAVQTALAASNREVEELDGQMSDARSGVEQAETRLREAQSRVMEFLGSEREMGLEHESAQRSLAWHTDQRDQLERELGEALAGQDSLADAQQEVEGRSAQDAAQVNDLRARLAAVQLEEIQQQSAYWTTRAAVAEQAVEGAGNRLEERTREVERLEARRTEMSARVDETQAALNELETGNLALHEQETALKQQIESMRVEIEPAEKELESAEVEETRLQSLENEAQRNLSGLERAFGQVQLDLTRKQEGLSNLRERITDDFGLVMFDYAADVSGPVPLPLDGMVEQLPVVTELPLDMEEHLSRQRSQLRRMGPINAEAKTEFDSESQRYEFMKVQVEDLRKAESDLKQVIAELDELTKREFSRTFDAVDKRFRETFVRLFGGGSARLALTDPENLVETGIDIEARLPGRREQGLALLSGGERSLTAIALVFALLKVSPTPVCVMDEVDAMLDEANVGRFRDLLVDLSRDTQFIIITHNRNTVQAADVIYGITMGRDSASQVISLRLDQVTDEMLNRS